MELFDEGQSRRIVEVGPTSSVVVTDGVDDVGVGAVEEV